MIKKDLAIIIPVLNCFEYTKQLISTIKTKFSYKIILIDNGSTDATFDYFTGCFVPYLLKYNLFSENLGVAGSWNFGIRYAIRQFDSKYFLILNNDILLNYQTIDLLLSEISNKNAVLVTATNVSGMITAPDAIIGLKPPVKSLLTEAPDFSCFLLGLEAIEKVGYFDEHFYPAYFEDNDYHRRINLAGLKAIKTSRAIYFHYGSRSIKENEDLRRKSNLGYTANREYYKNKWGGLPGHELFNVPFNKK